MVHTTERSASFRLSGTTLYCTGMWTSLNLEGIEKEVRAVRWPSQQQIDIDLSGLTGIDTAGTWILHRTLHDLEQRGKQITLHGISEEAETLLALVRRSCGSPGPLPEPEQPGLLEGIGRTTWHHYQQNIGFLAFIGETATGAVSQLARPRRIRWREVIQNIGEAGVNALPIVGLLSFLLGIVIAYQGGIQLRQYGGSLFIADLVGLSMLRELAPLITAIIVAGRTGSSYTAQIGTMKVTEELDALRAIGIPPMELLVLPKLAALLIALPLLTVYADIVGVLGGMVMANRMLGIGLNTFLGRLAEAVSLDSYFIGVGKAPVFAVIIASVGCYQGFRVGRSAESVGSQTTVSVVQSIFLVIIVDAAFSVTLSWLGL